MDTGAVTGAEAMTRFCRCCNFCIWLRTCTVVRVPTCAAMAFMLGRPRLPDVPNKVIASSNLACSSGDQYILAGAIRERICDGLVCGPGAIGAAVVIGVPSSVGMAAIRMCWDVVAAIGAGVAGVAGVTGTANVRGADAGSEELTISPWLGASIGVGPVAMGAENDA